ncbi:RagB/SusD family nutrient uptake outer membrane protein [Sphingobacterium sp. SYP-B4668]|uniref:RagB/SusD family nutrient uptake outer membrane protein n=1 Tax=Sphingobacterium sp. SYP-B4668 TaxID=2996035 RepID=UPI0022DD0327|nr:RagB/SusD family nutrient uptake outer membrane protein [Sphingobacterium sp. SYP-B4668]
MKRILFIQLCILLLAATSCTKGFFDQVPDDRLTLEQTFLNRATTEQYLAGVYGYIRREVDHNGANTPWEGLSDDMDVTYNDYPTYAMNLGNWDINRGDYNFWGHYYQGIRSAAVFLKYVDLNKDMTADEITKYKAEARVLRAWFYFCLMRQYGPVIIMPDEPMQPDATIDQLSMPRNSYDECVAYVAQQIDQALPDLPAQASNVRDWGRINKGMAIGMKSRLLLYAASPLFNGNAAYANFKNLDGKLLINQQYDQNKWKIAADAAKELIDLGLYSLYVKKDGQGKVDAYASLKGMFLNDWNSEVILANGRHTDMQPIDRSGTPRSLGGWSSWGPTQMLVDEFFMANGRAITDPQSGYTETGFTNQETSYFAAGTYNMYVGREPRFYVAISFDQSKWINSDKNPKPLVIEHYSGGNSGLGTSRNYSRTGYVNRKLVHPNTTLNPDRFAIRMEVLIRYGEILLNYVEALNEYDPGNPDILKYLNMIRERAGINLYGTAVSEIAPPASQELMRAAIRKERRVELAFENFRFFDTRRWKIAEQVEGGAFWGMNVEGRNKTEFAQRKVFETRVWRDRQYLWNITQSELNRNKNLVGNPGW